MNCLKLINLIINMIFQDMVLIKKVFTKMVQNLMIMVLIKKVFTKMVQNFMMMDIINMVLI